MCRVNNLSLHAPEAHSPATTAHVPVDKCIPASGASERTKVSAAQFFGTSANCKENTHLVRVMVWGRRRRRGRDGDEGGGRRGGVLCYGPGGSTNSPVGQRLGAPVVEGSPVTAQPSRNAFDRLTPAGENAGRDAIRIVCSAVRHNYRTRPKSSSSRKACSKPTTLARKTGNSTDHYTMPVHAGASPTTFPPVPPTAKCFACSATGKKRWRFDDVTSGL